MHTRIPGAVGTLFALDMAVKQYIEENVSEKEEKNFCGTKVLIRKVYNKGFAFNSMDSEPDKVKKASVITTAVILMLTLAESFREGHKVNKIPKDPMILFSFVNTQLRDRFSSLEEMCREMELDQSYIEETLEGAGFSYDPKRNCFR